MNNLKFRAWDKKNKIMIPAIHIFVNGPGVVWINKRDGLEGTDNIVATKDFELIQFTGITTRFGVEVYEDDIVVDGNGKKFVVKKFDNKHQPWGCGGFNKFWCYTKEADGSWLHAQKVSFNGMKVIGNIDQDPELLTND